MRSVFKSLILFGCCACVTLYGDDFESLPVIDVSALDSEWQVLFDSMHAMERVVAPFVETRTFAFRKMPKEYQGVFRKDIDGGVSLAYTQPEEMALHIGKGFAFYRKGEGVVRRIPQSSSQSAALTLFPQLLNFDLVGIAAFYQISGSLEDMCWQLILEANTNAQEAISYQRILISGESTVIQCIELIKSPKQRIVIEMGTPVYPEFYSSKIKEKYFFNLDSK